ncbi:MAG: AAA family ATPase [Muribaculaceae bacterium]|nr:AAA family ATPase [Muribaculaceae bacterium]
MINSIEINNFKSVKSVRLADCRRINVMIGCPNVGKSNILEALSLFDVPFLVESRDKYLDRLVRIQRIYDLFHNGDSSVEISVEAGENGYRISRQANNGLLLELVKGEQRVNYTFSPSLGLSTRKDYGISPDIHVYFFSRPLRFDNSNKEFLLPPFGNNLMEIVAQLPALKKHIASLFHRYGLKMVFDSGSQEIRAIRENGMNMFLIPFNALADSLQRLIFYKAAIMSNKDKLICFEEPEAHTFPPYITSVVDDIISDTSNQYFITTHSPYVMNSLLEKCGDELAVFVLDMDEGATNVKRLSDSELEEVYDNGVDMFFNIEAFK